MGGGGGAQREPPPGFDGAAHLQLAVIQASHRHILHFHLQLLGGKQRPRLIAGGAQGEGCGGGALSADGPLLTPPPKPDPNPYPQPTPPCPWETGDPKPGVGVSCVCVGRGV